MAVRFPIPCLVVLVGPSGSGKSAWAATNFRADLVISSDSLRALVGEGEHDQRAGHDAFDVLDLVLERRLRRGLFTVVDTLGLDDARRHAYLALARKHGVPAAAVAFDVPAAVCRQRNRTRARPVPDRVLADQLRRWDVVRAGLGGEGFDIVVTPDDVSLVPGSLLDAPAAADRQQEDAMPLEFGLHLNLFAWPGGAAGFASHVGEVAAAAEDAGFGSLWLMDHLIQIPQVGREWDDIPEAYTTLAFVAARTERIRLGVLVSPVTFRLIGVLAKQVATLDVLSGGRALCGLGVGWFEREHTVAGVPFPPLAERYARLEDALALLPRYWGKGSPSFEGRTISTPAAVCYPRPLQERVPILVGGSGERRTLRLVAQGADACNLFGEPEVVRRKVDVLHRHCADAGRDPTDVRVTQLSTTLAATNRDSLAAAIERHRPPSTTPEAYAAQVNAGTVADQVGRFRKFAEAGVHEAIVSLPGAGEGDGLAAIEAFAPVITAFR